MSQKRRPTLWGQSHYKSQKGCSPQNSSARTQYSLNFTPRTSERACADESQCGPFQRRAAISRELRVGCSVLDRMGLGRLLRAGDFLPEWSLRHCGCGQRIGHGNRVIQDGGENTPPSMHCLSHLTRTWPGSPSMPCLCSPSRDKGPAQKQVTV